MSKTIIPYNLIKCNLWKNEFPTFWNKRAHFSRTSYTKLQNALVHLGRIILPTWLWFPTAYFTCEGWEVYAQLIPWTTYITFHPSFQESSPSKSTSGSRYLEALVFCRTFPLPYSAPELCTSCAYAAGENAQQFTPLSSAHRFSFNAKPEIQVEMTQVLPIQLGKGGWSTDCCPIILRKKSCQAAG